MKDISTGKADGPQQAIGMSGIRKRYVSRICVESDEWVNAFPQRKLTVEWPLILLGTATLK